MRHWTIAFMFILINSQRIFLGSQASQPSGYIGCYPNSIANLVNKRLTHSNNGTYCIGICKSYGYRYAATQGFSCKCAKVKNLSVDGNDARCSFRCSSGEKEYCGGENWVSLYDTLSPEIYHECVTQETLGLEALKGHGTITVLNDNSATRCAFYCEEWQYTFSGTKSTFCICVDRLMLGFNISTKCKTKCPGDEEETCGGEGSVSLRRAGYVKLKIETPKVSRLETSSVVNITSIPKANVTDESMGNTLSVLLSTQVTVVLPKTDIKGSASKEVEMTAVYIWLPVGIIVAGSVVLIGCLIFRRYERKASERSVKWREVSSCHFKVEQGEHTLPDDDHYQTIDEEISQHVESSTQRITAVDAEYITPVGSNVSAGYVTPID